MRSLFKNKRFNKNKRNKFIRSKNSKAKLIKTKNQSKLNIMISKKINDFLY